MSITLGAFTALSFCFPLLGYLVLVALFLLFLGVVALSVFAGVSLGVLCGAEMKGESVVFVDEGDVVEDEEREEEFVFVEKGDVEEEKEW